MIATQPAITTAALVAERARRAERDARETRRRARGACLDRTESVLYEVSTTRLVLLTEAEKNGTRALDDATRLLAESTATLLRLLPAVEKKR